MECRQQYIRVQISIGVQRMFRQHSLPPANHRRRIWEESKPGILHEKSLVKTPPAPRCSAALSLVACTTPCVRAARGGLFPFPFLIITIFCPDRPMIHHCFRELLIRRLESCLFWRGDSFDLSIYRLQYLCGRNETAFVAPKRFLRAISGRWARTRVRRHFFPLIAGALRAC